MARTDNAVPRLAKVQKDPVHERVYVAIRDAAMAGKFAPGQSVTVRALAEALGTSTMPVREALRRLAAEKAFEIKRNRSIVVPVMTAEKLVEIRDVRIALEGLAARQAAAVISREDLGRLERNMRDMADVVERRDTRNYLAINQRFHFTIYRAARSEVLMPMIESLWLQIGPFLNLLLRDPKVADLLALKHHEDALAALRDGDGPAAEAAIAGDISEAAEFLLGYIAANDRHAV